MLLKKWSLLLIYQEEAVTSSVTQVLTENNAAIAEEMVPTPDIQGGSSDVFGNQSTDSVSSWNANEMIIIASNNNNRIHDR